MRPLIVWLALALTGFAALGGGYHAYLGDHPRRVAVVVDAAYPMATAWHRVPALLRSLQARRYTEFALATPRALQHGWSTRLGPVQGSPYGPRNLDPLRDPDTFPLLHQADTRYLITNAGPAEIRDLPGWTVIRP